MICASGQRCTAQSLRSLEGHAKTKAVRHQIADTNFTCQHPLVLPAHAVYVLMELESNSLLSGEDTVLQQHLHDMGQHRITVLRQVQHMLQKDSTSAFDSRSSTSSQTGAGAGQSARADQLRPFIQERCDQAVRSMAALLKDHLQQIGEPSMDLDGAKLVEQALLIGQPLKYHYA